MKIGIITLTQGTNYGNRLQIYAVQQVLKNLGHEPFLIENHTNTHGIIYQSKRIIKLLIGYKNAHEDFKREKSFKSFDSKWLSISNHSFDENYMKSNIADFFDAFVCGSDQIWNPYFTYLNGGCFADFPGAKLRISYAASFAEPQIPENLIEKYRTWLNGMRAISVREESGALITQKLIGKKAFVHIDPTMMLDAENWMMIEEAPDLLPKKPYIFKYFLGEIKDEVANFINNISRKNGYEVIDVLPDKKSVNYYLNPSNFVYLLHHSEFVVTDSFHANVFAILFQKPVRVFDRVDKINKNLNMSSRLDTLLKLFDCEEIRNNFSLEGTNKSVHFNAGKLHKERENAKDYLRKFLGEKCK